MSQDERVTKRSPTSANSRKRQLADCYQRGLHLAECEKNYDYAHIMFAECVRRDPGNLQFVDAMVKNLRARTRHPNKTRFTLFRRHGRTLRKAAQRNDWDYLFYKGVDLLRVDPWDVSTLRAMADACAQLHHNEVELVYLKQALDAEPRNVEVNRHCARSLGRMGQFDQAIACWLRVECLTGKDEEASRMIAVLAAEKLKYPLGGQSVLQSKNTAAVEPKMEESPSDVVLNPRQMLEQVIAQNPQDVTNYLQLAALLLDEKRYEAADTLLNAAIAACGERPHLLEQLERVRQLRAERHEELTEARSKEQQSDVPLRMPWFELALLAGLAAIVIQLVPFARGMAWRVISMRQWSHTGWILFNAVILLGLAAIRFGPDVRNIVRRSPRRRHPIVPTRSR